MGPVVGFDLIPIQELIDSRSNPFLKPSVVSASTLERNGLASLPLLELFDSVLSPALEPIGPPLVPLQEPIAFLPLLEPTGSPLILLPESIALLRLVGPNGPALTSLQEPVGSPRTPFLATAHFAQIQPLGTTWCHLCLVCHCYRRRSTH